MNQEQKTLSTTKPETIKTFRDISLELSAISEETQLSLVRHPINASRSLKSAELIEGDAFARTVGSKPSEQIKYREEKINRYQPGTINTQNWRKAEGDDMVMVYIDLNRRVMEYVPPKQSKSRDFFRVRFQNPALHTDKYGEPMKYQSPPGSGSFIWLPEAVIVAYEQREEISTLVVCEGEKKADKCCQHGIMAVGVSGIHNIASKNQLPREFEQLITVLKVKNVVFLLDSDLFELSLKKGKPANARPYNFYTAVRNFRDYFRAYAANEIELEIFFAYNLPTEKKEKGIDDLLAGTLRAREAELLDELTRLMLDKHAEGKYLKLTKVTEASETTLKQIWALSNAHEFANRYMDALKANGNKFKFWQTDWRIADDGSIELAQALLPEEQFWQIDYIDQGKTTKEVVTFNYYNAYRFLHSRGFGRYMAGGEEFMYVRKEGKILAEQKPIHIKDFVQDFTENIGEIKVLNMLYRGNKYLGPDSLSNLKYIEVDFIKPAKEYQYLYFNSKFWKVSADGIEEYGIMDLPAFVWKNKILGFEPTLIPGFCTVEGNIADNDFRLSEECKKSHFFQYLKNTCLYHWRKADNDLTEEDHAEHYASLISKMTAIGYMLHTYRDPGIAKAVVCMDNKISEVGQSNGRSGKSLIGVALEHMIPTVFVDGKKDLSKDPFVWEEVDERTDLIFIDDATKSLDFESLFAIITGRLTVNRKGKSKFKIPKDQTPKLLITTNHAINGDSDSFIDRQILLGFSDYYNANRKPIDDLGCLMFEEWDPEQWNLFYNFMASCLLMYIRHGIYQAPNRNLIKRRLRQEVGEEFIQWADTYYDESGKSVNTAIIKSLPYEHILDAVPNMRKWLTPTKFKQKLKKYCEYKGYQFNPQRNGEDHKSNGHEFFTVANLHYTVNQ